MQKSPRQFARIFSAFMVRIVLACVLAGGMVKSVAVAGAFESNAIVGLGNDDQRPAKAQPDTADDPPLPPQAIVAQPLIPALREVKLVLPQPPARGGRSVHSASARAPPLFG